MPKRGFVFGNQQNKRLNKSPTLHHEQQYRRLRNKLNHLIRIAKREYYDKQITEYKSNVRQTWEIVNEVINRRQKSTRLPSTFRVIDNHEVNDPEQIANGFCDFFTGLGPSLAQKITPSNTSFTNFLKNDLVNSLFFDSTDHAELIEICSSFRTGTAAGFDNIHMDIVKKTIDTISKPLAHIINLSLSNGVVPKQLKEDEQKQRKIQEKQGRNIELEHRGKSID